MLQFFLALFVLKTVMTRYMKLPLEPNKDGRYGGILLGVLRVKHTHTNEVKRNGI